MPGGSGKVSAVTMLASKRTQRAFRDAGTPAEIFFHLDAGHAYFDVAAGYLYFVDTPQDKVPRTVSQVLAGSGSSPEFEQLHLDSHRLFNGARRVALTAEQAKHILVALSLVGVRVTSC